MRTREEIEEEFFGGELTISEYEKIYHHRLIDPTDKEQHFMEVLLDIRDLLQNPPTIISSSVADFHKTS